MSIQLKPTRAPNPAVVYYLADRAPVVRLRPLSPLDQMYAYWGSDLAV